MDIEHNELKAIMAKINTDVRNADCDNDPEYVSIDQLHKEALDMQEAKQLPEIPEQPEPKYIKRNGGRLAKVIVLHTEPNRKARRLKSNIGKILNNRKKTKGRGGNPHRVLSKMAKFHLTIAAKTGRL